MSGANNLPCFSSAHVSFRRPTCNSINMSDKHTSSGYHGSLVDDSIQNPGRDSTYTTGNYPPPDDTTSSGGYSSQDTWSNAAQRGSLVDQSVNGGPIGQELQDAKQGEDTAARQDFRHEAERDFDRQGAQGLNPYGRNVDSRKEAEEMLASRYRDARGKHYESGPAASNDGDVGA